MTEPIKYPERYLLGTFSQFYRFTRQIYPSTNCS